MEVDQQGLEVLTRDECLYLLSGVPVARIGLSLRALPVVLPVNFVVDREQDQVIIRTAAGSKLDAALLHAVVALEADHVDPMSHGGWSVLVQGTSRVLMLPGEIERARTLALQPWVNAGTRDHFVAISMDIVSGRRVTAF
jgi:uncharacterized protein